MTEKCSIQSIRLRRLDDDVSNPALASLVKEGWKPIGSVVLDDGSEPILHLIFSPPESAKNQDVVLKVLLASISLKLF